MPTICKFKVNVIVATKGVQTCFKETGINLWVFVNAIQQK